MFRFICLTFIRISIVAGLLSFGALHAQGVTDTEILIGGFGPTTGPAAYIGLGGRDGLSLAVKEINASGGINGRKVRVIFEDDGHSPTKALASVKKLIDQDKVFMIFCAAGSNATVGTIDYVKEQKKIMYVSFASAPAVTWPFSSYLFRGATTEVPRYGELYSEYVADGMKAKKVAIMNGREEYPKNEGNALADQLKTAYGVSVVARAEFNIGDKDFTPQLLEIKQAAPDVIAFFGNPAEASIAMRQAREFGLTQSFFVGATMVDTGFISAAKANAEGARGFALIPFLPGTKNNEMTKWEANWKAEYPNLPVGRPNVFDVMAYTDMYAIAQAMKAAGKNLTTETMISSLEKLKNYQISPLASPLTFTNKNHIGNLTLHVMQVKDGAWTPLGWAPSRASMIPKKYE
jgi:branched-chain amino acid transport system substrate-binding protein